MVRAVPVNVGRVLNGVPAKEDVTPLSVPNTLTTGARILCESATILAIEPSITFSLPSLLTEITSVFPEASPVISSKSD